MERQCKAKTLCWALVNSSLARLVDVPECVMTSLWRLDIGELDGIGIGCIHIHI